jgi:hypothetical protein
MINKQQAVYRTGYVENASQQTGEVETWISVSHPLAQYDSLRALLYMFNDSFKNRTA